MKSRLCRRRYKLQTRIKKWFWDKKKIKGIALIVLGVLGGIFICTFDTIVGKPVNDITGPKSISALIICGLFIITGIRFLLKNPEKQ